MEKKSNGKERDWCTIIGMFVLIWGMVAIVGVGAPAAVAATITSIQCEWDADAKLELYNSLIESGTSPDIAAEVVFGKGK